MEPRSFAYIVENYTIFIIIGSLIFILGIAIPLFHWHFLIAGINTRPKEELEKMNLRYIERYFGWFTKIMGILIILNPFACSYLGYESFISTGFLIIVLGISALTIGYGVVNKKKIYR